MVKLDASQLSLRELNVAMKEAAKRGESIVVTNPGARHNLGVCVLHPCKITFEGSVGYYCASMFNGPEVLVKGNAGWGFGEHLVSGTIRLKQHASLAAGASIKDGELIIEGDVGSRAGISMKGGLLAVGGNAGYLTGFIAQKGTIVICGDVGDAVGDSMYETLIYVGGKVASVGTDARVTDVTPPEIAWLNETVDRLKLKTRKSTDWKKVESMKLLYNFDKLKLKDRHVI